jgi:hypothetical protein
MSRSITLSTLEYDILWEHLGFGTRPPVLEITGHGRTADERAELRLAGWDSLHAKGFGMPGELDPLLVRYLSILACPVWAIDARLRLRGHRARVTGLAGAVGDRAVLARLDPAGLTLTGVRATELASAAVSLLPACRPGVGPLVTLPADTLDTAMARAGRAATELRGELILCGLDANAAHRVATVLRSSVRTGQFGMSHTRRPGPIRRAEQVVTFYDTRDGRYLFLRKPSGGRQWVTLVGAGVPKIVRALDELRVELDRVG